MRPPQLEETLRYIESLYAPEDQGLTALRERLTLAGRWGVNVGANEGKILQILLRLCGARKGVEIGALFGYSAVWIARALPENGRLYSIERDPECAKMARLAFEECGVSNKISLIERDAEMALEEVAPEGPFDFVFIDANKSSYVSYLEWSLTNVRSGGLIVADNTLMGGRISATEKPASLSSRQWDELRKFNELVAIDARISSSTIVPTSEGLTVAIRA